jgi:SAM-dependent methyltransferase
MHRLMLLDEARMSSYRRALRGVVHSGRTVLDVGAGSGVLSVMAAQAGASRVYAVEPTATAALAQRVVEANGVADRVEVIQRPLEEVELPERVDVVVSEWMGCYGVDENLLAPVLLARDRWMDPGGWMVPARVTAFLAPAWDADLARDLGALRERPGGVDLGPLVELTGEEVLLGRHGLGPEELAAPGEVMWSLDLFTCPVAEARAAWSTAIEFTVFRGARCNCLAAWFSAELVPGRELTNAPGAAPTHWGRAAFPLHQDYTLEKEDRLRVEVSCEPGGPGFTHARWSFARNEGPAEYHDTRRDVTLPE